MPPTVGPVTERDPNELPVPLGVLNASDSLAVSEFMPQLVRDLQPEWPVTGYHFRKRNPYKPEGTETAVVFHLLSPLLTELGQPTAGYCSRKDPPVSREHPLAF
jgi:hypothetical protein